jgi:LacI family transcriptional regulator
MDLVRCNSEQGGYELTRHLIELGHRNIMTITGPREVSTSQDRALGYRRAMKEAGLKDFIQIHYGSFTQASGYKFASEAMAGKSRPTAIFGTNNFISIGVLKALKDNHLRVPEDVSVVGFDDLPDSMIIDPFLTVAAQPAYEMGRQATGILLKRISAEGKAESQEVVLPTEIIIRRSTGAPK